MQVGSLSLPLPLPLSLASSLSLSDICHQKLYLVGEIWIFAIRICTQRTNLEKTTALSLSGSLRALSQFLSPPTCKQLLMWLLEEEDRKQGKHIAFHYSWGALIHCLITIVCMHPASSTPLVETGSPLTIYEPCNFKISFIYTLPKRDESIPEH